MRRPLALLAAAAIPLSASVALAATMTDTGTIRQLEPATHQLSLNDGKTFSVPAGWNVSGYKVGQKVTVSYEQKNGKMNATKVTAAKS